MVVRDLDHRLPTETRWVADEMKLRLRPTVECDVEPVVFLETLRRLVFIVAERDLADGCAAFHLNEADVGEGLVVVRVRLSRDDIKAAVSFSTLSITQPRSISCRIASWTAIRSISSSRSGTVP
jgi:hypothetical protein